MVVKIPVVSLQHFMEVNVLYSFNAIRAAKHPHADDLIAYLYELLFLQQKIAISLHEFLRLTDYALRQKKEALFINAEINAILGADLVFTYLKASIEKMIVLLGLTHEIVNLDAKKTHRSKMEALLKALPKKVTEQYYWNFVHEFIRSENLDELNNFRSGLLHKKGIADLQPHNYFNKQAEQIPLWQIFTILHEQHAKNTAVLLGILAILTDKLVELDPPHTPMAEIFEIMSKDGENFTSGPE
jgi:hypothetical protein